MIWRTTSWCQIIFKWSKGDWNTSMFRTFPKMFKCFQNRSKQTVVKSAKSLKLENTFVALKTQIPAKTVVKTQCHRNSIQWNILHSRTFSAHQKCRISMNTDVKCSITEASSNELLYQIEVHNGLIPAYIVKKHDGPIIYSQWIRSTGSNTSMWRHMQAELQSTVRPCKNVKKRDLHCCWVVAKTYWVVKVVMPPSQIRQSLLSTSWLNMTWVQQALARHWHSARLVNAREPVLRKLVVAATRIEYRAQNQISALPTPCCESLRQ